jgi:pyridoxal phosphate enzyme (YggS family)
VIADRVAAVRERICRAAERASRPPDAVTLVAVSKTFPPEAVRSAFAAGIRSFGENRVQEADSKVQALADLAPEGLCWHLIGHLQSNKARRAAVLFDAVHSLDSLELGRRLGQAAQAAGRELRALVQVDLAGEQTKFGLPERELMGVLEALRGTSGLRLVGLMLLPPFLEDPEAVRPFFRRLRVLRDDAAAAGLLAGEELSMGMSHDFEVAIDEGATMVRVGSAIFGERPGGH